MTLLPKGSDRSTNSDFGMTSFPALCTPANKFTLPEVKPLWWEEGSYSKATWRGHLWSTGCQTCKLLKGKKQVSASATGTISVTYCKIPVPSEDTTACLHHRSSCCICESLPQRIKFIHSTLKYSRLSSCIQCQFYNKAIEIEKSSSKRQIWNQGRNIRAHRAKWGKKGSSCDVATGSKSDLVFEQMLVSKVFQRVLLSCVLIFPFWFRAQKNQFVD